MDNELIIELRKHYGIDNHVLSDNEIINYYKDTLILDVTKLSISFDKFVSELKKVLFSFKFFKSLQ